MVELYAFHSMISSCMFSAGLNPRGPNFKDKPKEGRLDVTDADFVDNIHTNGQGSLTIDFGIGLQIGDVDFVPNWGGIQPGCANRRRGIWTQLGATYKTAFDSTGSSDNYFGHG